MKRINDCSKRIDCVLCDGMKQYDLCLEKAIEGIHKAAMTERTLPAGSAYSTSSKPGTARLVFHATHRIHLKEYIECPKSIPCSWCEGYEKCLKLAIREGYNEKVRLIDTRRRNA